MLTKKRLSSVKVRTSWSMSDSVAPVISVNRVIILEFGFDLSTYAFDLVEEIREMYYNLPIYGLLKSCQFIPLTD